MFSEFAAIFVFPVKVFPRQNVITQICTVIALFGINRVHCSQPIRIAMYIKSGNTLLFACSMHTQIKSQDFG